MQIGGRGPPRAEAARRSGVLGNADTTRIIAPPEITTRPAVADDVDWILSQLKEFAKANETKFFLFGDEEYARIVLLGWIAQHFVRIAERGSERIGFVSGFLVPHPYNPKIRLFTETFWWVTPEHRGTRADLILLNEFTDWGKANADMITFSLLHSSQVKEETLEKRGYHMHEKAFLQEV